MPKFFVVSDIHSFFTPLKKALDEKGFDSNNENHWLIVCGDCFDRGPDSVAVLKFLMGLERKVIVKGNHDILLEELCKRGFPYSHDKHNGTFKTVISFGDFNGRNFDECCHDTWNKTARYRELLVNYFETQNYIFVHSWIPTDVHFEGENKPWYQQGKTLAWMEGWRDANDVEWEEAMWGNPFSRWEQGLNKTGKKIVFGHWHCSTGHAIATNGELSEFGEDAVWEPFIHDSIIAIDRCTAHTGEVNVLVLEDEFLEG